MLSIPNSFFVSSPYFQKQQLIASEKRILNLDKKILRSIIEFRCLNPYLTDFVRITDEPHSESTKRCYGKLH